MNHRIEWCQQTEKKEKTSEGHLSYDVMKGDFPAKQYIPLSVLQSTLLCTGEHHT